MTKIKIFDRLDILWSLWRSHGVDASERVSNVTAHGLWPLPDRHCLSLRVGAYLEGHATGMRHRAGAEARRDDAEPILHA